MLGKKEVDRKLEGDKNIYIYIYIEKEQVNRLEANLLHLKPMEGDFSIDDYN